MMLRTPRRSHFPAMAWLLVLLLSLTRAAAQTPPVGVNLSGGYFTRVDAVKDGDIFRDPVNLNTPVPTDANGWPLTDAFLNLIAVGYAQPVNTHRPDISGVYHVSFNGKANLDGGSWPFTVTNLQYNAASNLTTLDITVPQRAGENNLFLNIRNSQRTAGSATNTGITNLKVIRPGYAANTTQYYTTSFLNTLHPFQVVRIPDQGPYPAYPATVEWANRESDTFASPSSFPRYPWEEWIRMANQANVDIWLCLPVNASDNYVTQLATLLKNTLNPGHKVYLEYSNEVWNGSYDQFRWNLDAANAETAAGSNLAVSVDGVDDPANEVYRAIKRVARRISEISSLFKNVWGAAAINTTIRPIVATQYVPLFRTLQLAYIEKFYGSPRNIVYGAAIAPYWNLGDDNARINETFSIDTIIALLTSNNTQNGLNDEIPTFPLYTSQAVYYGVKSVTYEGGQDLFDGVNDLSLNRYNSNYDPRMGTLVSNYLTAWYQAGGDLNMYLGLSGAFTKYGTWGLTENHDELNVPKYSAAKTVATSPTPTVTAGQTLPATIKAATYNTYWDGRAGTTTLSDGTVTVNTSNNFDHFDYLLNVPASTTITVSLNVSSNDGTGSVQTLVDEYLVGRFAVPNTGGQDTRANMAAGSTTLTPGLHVLRVYPDVKGWFLNTVTITGGSGPTVPAAPTNLTATAGNAQVGLSWTASAGATSYSVYRGTSAGGESGTAIVSGLTGTAYTNTGLTNGTTYYYQVKAVNSAGASGASNEASAQPVAPSGTNTQINAGGGAVAPFVADANFSGGLTANNYTGSINTAGVTNPAPQAVYQSERYGNFSYTLSGLTAGASCTVRLHFCENYWTAAGQRTFNVAINGSGVLSGFDIFATAGAAHKAVVKQFTATANSSGQIVVAFTSIVNNALVNGLEVTSSGGGGPTLPATPTGLTATAGSSQVSLRWNGVAGATSYNLYRSTTAGGEGSTPFKTGLTGTAYTNGGLTNGTTYYYQVSAVNSAGQSGKSSEASATPKAAGVSIAIANPGFETGDFSGWFGGGQVQSVVNNNQHGGSYAARNDGQYNSTFQTITGLKPNTSYTLTAWGKLATATAGNNHSFYVDNYGGAQKQAFITGTTYKQYSITFTTGASNTSALIGEYEQNGAVLTCYFDDFVLTQN